MVRYLDIFSESISVYGFPAWLYGYLLYASWLERDMFCTAEFGSRS